MRLKLAAFLLVSTSTAAVAQTYTVGKVRIEVLSPNLIRLEQKGPKGFEDRQTFNVVGRQGWTGARVTDKKEEGVETLRGPNWTVRVENGGSDLQDVSILPSNGGTALYRFDGKLPNSVWFPAPASVPKAWVIADAPRLVPSKYGLTPSGDDDPNSDWDVSNDAPDVYVFLPDGSYDRLRADFLHLTGPVELPPLYALGYTDSKYYAYYQDEALKRMDEYRRRQIPIDTFVVDTDWRIGGSAGYTPNSNYFPDLPSFFKDAHAKHIHIMFNDHPEPKSKTNALDPVELNYRYDGLGNLLKEGLDIWWYDRNWGVSLIDPAPNLRHEVWGMKLYHDMTLRAKPGKRPLIMTNVDGIDNGFRNRPPEIVAHRYPVQWTGDTRSQWEFLRRGVENAVFEGVEGLNPWVNEDLGGHVGHPDPDLYIRYLQYGSVCPFMRVHCTKGQTREPWAYGPDAERIVPQYIEMRYRLMPLFYALARNAYDTGMPLLRRLDLDYPQFKQAAANDQFVIGNDLLVAPIIGGHDAAIVPSSAFPLGVKAEYFAGKEPTGEPALIRDEKQIDFDWGQGSPGQGIPADGFSARFTGKVTVPKDHVYHLAITSDDGCRVWIDGKLAVDKWVPQDSVTTEARTDLQPGSTHDLKVEYMELTGGALVRLRWKPVTKAVETSQRSCWIPPGTWTDVWTGKQVVGPKTIEVHVPLSQMPMFLRSGAILPIGPDVQWTGQKDWSKLGLDLVPGNGSFSLYEDDGSSLGYQTGQFRRTSIKMTEQGRDLRIDIAPAKGSFAGGPKTRSWTIRVAVPRARLIQVDGKAVRGKILKRSVAQPFRNSGGEPYGDLVQIEIPAASVSKSHTIRIRT